MRESYDEGLANHIGPELCVDNGNIISEALTGESVGWVLSPVRELNPSADVLQECRRQHVINRYEEGDVRHNNGEQERWRSLPALKSGEASLLPFSGSKLHLLPNHIRQELSIQRSVLSTLS